MVTPNRNLIKNQPIDQITRNKDRVVMPINKVQERVCFISQVEPKSVDEASKYDFLIKDMKEELEKIEKNNT